MPGLLLFVRVARGHEEQGRIRFHKERVPRDDLTELCGLRVIHKNSKTNRQFPQ